MLVYNFLILKGYALKAVVLARYRAAAGCETLRRCCCAGGGLSGWHAAAGGAKVVFTMHHTAPSGA